MPRGSRDPLWIARFVVRCDPETRGLPVAGRSCGREAPDHPAGRTLFTVSTLVSMRNSSLSACLADGFPRAGARAFALRATVVLLILAPVGAAGAGPPPAWPGPHAPQAGRREAEADFFGSTLVRELEETHVFLLSHRRGLPYTSDPRPLEPFAEVVRLQTDCQALGYLNLYRLTGKELYLRQARERLDYILTLGDVALGHKHYDGQLAYGYLIAYELTGETRYREAGLGIARALLSYSNNVMNWGLLAAIGLGRAYRLTGDERFLERAREVTGETAARQFPDGAFSHRDGSSYGENAPYTAWMAFEMLLHRLDDPEDPDVEVAILRAARFLEHRVNADGSVNYADSLGSYASDPGNVDCRGWNSELPSLAYVLRAVGKVAEARRVLEFLFRQEMRSPERGSYPDKWAFEDSTNQWTLDRKSVG
jgi:hypothetical protein